MKLAHTEVKFYPEEKSQTGLSSLPVSCKRALSEKKGRVLKVALQVAIWELVAYKPVAYKEISALYDIWGKWWE